MLIAERAQTTFSAPRQTERALLDAIDEGFCIIEVLFDDAGSAVDYRFLDINAAFEQQTGIERAVGRRMRDIAPDHEEHWFELFGRVAQTGESMRFDAEAKALERYYTVNAFRVGAPEQRRVAVLFRDISERKRLEQQLRESDRRKDEFLATLAHELRNPLAPISTALTLLRHPNNKVPVEQLYALLDRQVGHMVRLVDDLLDLSRIARGIVELDKQPVELADIIRRAIETSGPFIDARECRLALALASEPVLVQGDPTRLVQVVSNLLNNAAKYTQAGGHIRLTLAREGAWARVSVRDNGIGIPPDMLERVFEMFTQVDRSRTDGLGVGLTVVRSLVALHGGRVEVRSEGLGHGSEFIVGLPVAISNT